MIRNNFKIFKANLNIPIKNLIGVFVFDKKISRKLVIIYCLINVIVLVNAVFHDPRIGYDTYSHLDYIRTLANFKIPESSDTQVFYTPPLYYLIPSLLYSTKLISLGVIAKLAQLLNMVFSVILTYFLIKICRLISLKNENIAVNTLFLLSLLTVYYKSFSFIRSESLLSLLFVVSLYYSIKTFINRELNFQNSLILGILFSLSILTRQTGFILIFSVIIFFLILSLKVKNRRFVFFKFILISLITTILFGGWYYFLTFQKYKILSQFNRLPQKTFSLNNQPLYFYFDLSLSKLFSDPVRKSFPNRLIPIFYSETWGDYWGYFSVFSYDLKSEGFESGRIFDNLPSSLATNRYQINRYLGRINLLGIFPSLLLLSGLIYGFINLIKFIKGKKVEKAKAIESIISLIVLLSFIFYFSFLIMYPDPDKGDTVKATYLLFIFPLIAILGAVFLRQIQVKNKYLYRVILIILVGIFLHNLPIYITRYIFLP